MKVTKVDRTRIAVSGRKMTDSSRGILYPSPNKTKEIKLVEEQIKDRVESANKLYSAFFAFSSSRELERRFEELVNLAKGSSSGADFLLSAKEYSFTSKGNKIDIASSKTSLKSMKDYIREVMTDEWQSEKYCYAAACIMTCICDKEYSKKIAKVSTEIANDFVEISQSSQRLYLGKDILAQKSDFERCFTSLLKTIATYRDKNVSKRIYWLQNSLNEIWDSKNRTKIKLANIRYPYATEERLKALLVRMRKTLKRGTDGEVAILLMQGLAQMDGKTLSTVITEMMQSEKGKQALRQFLTAVHEDYHKTHIIKSIKNHDVKVQLRDDVLDLASANIDKVSSRKKNRIELTKTLEKYASSEKMSNQVLLDIKGVLFDYFMWKEPDVKAEFVTVDRLWNIPNRLEELFDEGFEAVDPNKDTKVEANVDLFYYFSQEKPRNAAIKARINYVNCGKYQQLIKDEQDAFRKYWIAFAKDFVEKNYVSKKKKYEKADCYKTELLLACWKDAIRFLCGKYIDIGKAVFHFAMPDSFEAKDGAIYGELREEYKDGVSSFAYEAIKAEETLQRNIANSVVSAAASFTRSVLDASKHEALIANPDKKDKEDVFFMKEDDLKECMKDELVSKKQLLRFYGGNSQVEGMAAADSFAFLCEQREHLMAIRNENFHYTDGKKVQISTQYAKQLWENEIKVYQDVIRQKYYSNNVAMFYPEGELQKLVAKLYQKHQWAEAQVPAFRTVFKRKDLPEYIRENQLSLSWNKDDVKHVIFEGAIYFLLKEIYYRDFVLNKDAAKYFFAAVVEHEKRVTEEANKANNAKKAAEDIIAEAKKHKTAIPRDIDIKALKKDVLEKQPLANAGKHFKSYVDVLKAKYDAGELTFGNVCQFINAEYNQQNKPGEEEIFKHFKILFPMCMKNAFVQYVKQFYGFILKPVYNEIIGESTYLDTVEISCVKMNLDMAHWFTFAHYIHPRQLNFLIGDIKGYIQYRQDVVRRADYAGQLEDVNIKKKEQDTVEDNVAKVSAILEVLDFVRNTAGRVSNNFDDYYESPEEYAQYLANYIAFDRRPGKSAFDSLKYFCQNTLLGDAVVDIYADAENPKLLRNVEVARMYAGGDVTLPEYKKVTKEEIIRYYAQKDRVANIQSQGMCKSVEEQKDVIEFQRLKGRITLNEVTDLFCMVNDLLAQLVSLSYLRERDQLYLFLGFYYMALRNPDGWSGEILDEFKNDKFDVARGLVLYQTVGIFDFGTPLLAQKSNGKWELHTGNKFRYFLDNHKASYTCVMRLLQEEKFVSETTALRNYVDHSKYYIKHDKSILDLFSEFYTKFFGYNNKLRRAVLCNLQNVLEQYFVEGVLLFEGATKIKINEQKTTSKKFTYKYQEKTNTIKTVELPAKSDEFITAMKKLLEYKN